MSKKKRQEESTKKIPLMETQGDMFMLLGVERENIPLHFFEKPIGD